MKSIAGFTGGKSERKSNLIGYHVVNGEKIWLATNESATATTSNVRRISGFVPTVFWNFIWSFFCGFFQFLYSFCYATQFRRISIIFFGEEPSIFEKNMGRVDDQDWVYEFKSNLCLVEFIEFIMWCGKCPKSRKIIEKKSSTHSQKNKISSQTLRFLHIFFQCRRLKTESVWQKLWFYLPNSHPDCLETHPCLR